MAAVKCWLLHAVLPAGTGLWLEMHLLWCCSHLALCIGFYVSCCWLSSWSCHTDLAGWVRCELFHCDFWSLLHFNNSREVSCFADALSKEADAGGVV